MGTNCYNKIQLVLTVTLNTINSKFPETAGEVLILSDIKVLVIFLQKLQPR